MCTREMEEENLKTLDGTILEPIELLANKNRVRMRDDRDGFCDTNLSSF